MMMRRTGLAIAVLALGGCCGSDRVTDTGYASMQVYGPQISACIASGDCERLCADRFGLGDDVEIVGCEITTIDRRAPGTSSGTSAHDSVGLTEAIGSPASGVSSKQGARGELSSTKTVEPRAAGTSSAAGEPDDLALVVGVSLRVAYVAPAPCEFGIDVSAGDDGWSDDDAGDDATDDGSTDDGSDDYPDDDSGDDSGDDGDDGDTGDEGDSGDDGDTGDEGGGDDGGGDDGGWGGTIRGGGARSVHSRTAASDHRPAGMGRLISGGAGGRRR